MHMDSDSIYFRMIFIVNLGSSDQTLSMHVLYTLRVYFCELNMAE